MFTLFYSLYLAMFSGTWNNINQVTMLNHVKSVLNPIGKLLTSIFNDGVVYETFGTEIYNYTYEAISLVLATITSIGIVVMAVKGIKRVFGVFFMGIRR